MLLSKAWETCEFEKRIEGFSQQTLKAYRLQATLLIRFFIDVKLLSEYQIEQELTT